MDSIWVNIFVLLCTTPTVFSLPQQPPPAAPSTSLSQDPVFAASASAALASASLAPYVAPKGNADIIEWGAYGDSFTAGIGSVGADDYIAGSDDCARYKSSYPSQMQTNTKWPGDANQRKLNFGACTGNKVDDMIKNQVRAYLIAFLVTWDTHSNFDQ